MLRTKQKKKKGKINQQQKKLSPPKLAGWEEKVKKKIKTQKKSSAPASLLVRASGAGALGARPGQLARSPRRRFGRRLPAPGSLHSLSERVSYWEQSRGLGSSSHAWCWLPGVPCGRGAVGAAVTTPLGSRMVSGL